MGKVHKLVILRSWLENKENMNSDLLFAEGVDSAEMLPAVRAAVALLRMPKAEKYSPPWDAYYTCAAIASEEISTDEARVWNLAQKFVIATLNGRR